MQEVSPDVLDLTRLRTETPSQGQQPQYRIASTKADRAGAFRLLYSSYLRAGLIPINPNRMRVTPFHLLPTTSLCVAALGSEVISTLTLIEDASLGIPMQSMVPRIVEREREAGVKLAEIACVADRRKDIRRFLPTFGELLRWAAQIAQQRGIEKLMLVAHPHEAKFFRTGLGFLELKDPRAKSSENAPEFVALSLELRSLKSKRWLLHERLFREAIDPAELSPSPLTSNEIKFFEPLLDKRFRTCRGTTVRST